MNREQFSEQFNGQLLKTSELVEILGGRTAISRFKQAGIIEPICHGYYFVGDNYNPVTIGYQILAKDYQDRVVISGMSALFLHELSDQMPDIIEIDVLNNSDISSDNEVFIPKRVSASRFIGIETIEIEGSQFKIYDKERTLIDLIKGKAGKSSEYFNKAVALYVSKGVNFEKLSEYQEVFSKEVEFIKSSIKLLQTTNSIY